MDRRRLANIKQHYAMGFYAGRTEDDIKFLIEAIMELDNQAVDADLERSDLMWKLYPESMGR